MFASENENGAIMATKGKTEGKYEYLSLAELSGLEGRGGGYDNKTFSTQRAHVYGIVSERYEPQQTRTQEYYLKLKLFDETLNPDYEDVKDALPAYVEVMCFANRKEDLPIKARPGDVIRFHRLEVKFWNGQHQQQQQQQIQFVAKIGALSGGVGYSKTHFALFSGEPAQILDGESVKQKSSNQITFVESDRKRIEELIEWKNSPECLGMPKISYLGKYDRRIQDIEREKQYDLHVKILDIAYKDGYPDVLFVWDGSDAQPLSLDTPDWPENDEALEPVYWLPIDQSANPVKDVGREDLTLSTRKMMEEMGDTLMYGTAFPVYIRGFDFTDELPKRGMWVKLRNLNAGVHSLQLNGAFFANSKWMVESAGHPTWMSQVEFRQKNNIVANWAPSIIESPNITMVRHPQVKWDTIRSALLKEAPNRHRLYVRVQKFWPEDETKWCIKDPITKEWEYMFKMLVEDATGILRITISPEEGKYFFRGLPPCDLGANRATLQQLKKRANTLLKGSTGINNWVQICVRQFIPRKRGRMKREQLRTWELFGTAMVKDKM